MNLIRKVLGRKKTSHSLFEAQKNDLIAAAVSEKIMET